MWHKAFVALINYWAYFVAFEEEIYHLERWPLAPGWWRAPMPTGGWNPCGGGRGREGGRQEDSVGIANMHSASPISILKNIY
jgi:hypothetical protein